MRHKYFLALCFVIWKTFLTFEDFILFLEELIFKKIFELKNS